MRTITLKDGREMRINASALAPFIYKNAFDRDLSRDFGDLMGRLMRFYEVTEKEDVTDPEIVEALDIPFVPAMRILYAMYATQAKKEGAAIQGFDAWLCENDDIDILSVISDICEEGMEGFFSGGSTPKMPRPQKRTLE